MKHLEGSKALKSMADSPFRRDDIRAQKLDYICRAASHLFNKKGFDATSLDEVAESIGISKPSIYYYYQNKSELLLGCYTRTLDICEALICQTKTQAGTSLDRLCYFARELIYLHCTDGAIATVSEIHSLPVEAMAEIRQRNTALTQQLTQLVEEGVKDRSLRTDLGAVTTYFIMGGVNWIPRWYQQDGSLSADEIADAYVQFITGGLAACDRKTV